MIMSDVIHTNVEPLHNVQRGLLELRDHIRPIEQKFKKVLDDYDCEISECLGSLQEEGDYGDIDPDERRRKLEQKKADLQETKAACVAYTHAKEEFLRALDAFYSTEGYASEGGASVLSNSISALERYLSAGNGATSIQSDSRDKTTRISFHDSQATEKDDFDGDYSGPVLSKSQSELWIEGNRAIDRTIEVMRDDLKDKGYDDIQIVQILRERLVSLRGELSRDVGVSSSALPWDGSMNTSDQGSKTR